MKIQSWTYIGVTGISVFFYNILGFDRLFIYLPLTRPVMRSIVFSVVEETISASFLPNEEKKL